jgi:hypothetical protein
MGREKEREDDRESEADEENATSPGVLSGEGIPPACF